MPNNKPSMPEQLFSGLQRYHANSVLESLRANLQHQVERMFELLYSWYHSSGALADGDITSAPAGGGAEVAIGGNAIATTAVAGLVFVTDSAMIVARTASLSFPSGWIDTRK